MMLRLLNDLKENYGVARDGRGLRPMVGIELAKNGESNLEIVKNLLKEARMNRFIILKS